MRIPALTCLFLLFLSLCGTCEAMTTVKSGGSQYLMAPAPAWVAKVSGGASIPANASTAGATQVVLSDVQVNLLGPKPVTYVHIRSVAQERAGLEQVSSVRIAFNPRFEVLTLHDLAVFRDGKRIDRLKSSRIDLAQREHRLEEGIYDEDVEAIIALNDVRVGDTVEYAYSVAGANPVFGGKYARLFGLNREQPVAKLAVRIQYSAARQLHYRLYRSDLPVTETVSNGVKILSLRAEGLAPVRFESGTPSWFSMFPWLQVSEYETWEDVNTWARSLYAVPKDLSPEIESVLDRIKGEAKTPQELAIKTLAWVQNEIRYYSVSVGTSSHRPNPPNVTVRQRFGDCKDKSVLLSAMLQRLGLQAEPALVSTPIRKTLADLLPTPQLFDHAIVRLQLGDQTYWLDGTQTYQGSALETLGFVPLGKALPAATPSQALVDVVEPMQYRSGMTVTEAFKVTKYGAPATMVLRETYFGIFAEYFRRRAATDGVKRFVDERIADYGKDFPNIALNGEPGVEDDLRRNAVTVTQTFTIPLLFTYEAGRLPMAAVYARSIVPLLRFAGMPDRKYPLELTYPAILEHTLTVDLPNKMPGTPPAPASWQDRHISLTNRIQVEGNRLSFVYGARMLQDHVGPADFPDFSAKFKRNGWPLLFSSLQPSPYDTAQLRIRLLRDFDKSGINFRNSDQVDSFYQKFLRDYAIADEAIRAGLLDGQLLAAAYRDRAEAASQLGRRDEALADMATAIQLDPSDAGYILKAEIELYAGRYREALQSLQSIQSDRGKARTLVAAGMVNYYLENFPEAQQSFSKAAEVAESGELPYVLIWLAVATKKAGQEPSAAIAKYRSRLAPAWPSEAIPVVLGEEVPEKLIAAARRDEKESRARLCEAYFYLGQKALLDGKLSDAKLWFGRSIDTKVVMYREHILSQQELKRLD